MKTSYAMPLETFNEIREATHPDTLKFHTEVEQHVSRQVGRLVKVTGGRRDDFYPQQGRAVVHVDYEEIPQTTKED